MNLKQYQKNVEKTWISNDKDLERIVLGIGGEAGEIQELFKKLFRGDIKKTVKELNEMARKDVAFYGRKSSYYGQEKITEKMLLKISLKKEIGDLFYYLAKVCNYYNLSIEKILEENIAKLQSRKERGKIRGSGDQR